MPEQVPGLLLEGLDIAWEQKIVNIAYSEDENGVTALFEDANEVTGSMLVGTDGPQLSVRSHLVGSDNAKPTPIDFATMICATQYSPERSLFLRSAPYHSCFQIASHPDGYYSALGLDASDLHHAESWTFTHYISFPEPRTLENKMTLAEHVAYQKAIAAKFADPWRSSIKWMPDNTTTAWYGRLRRWDPALPEHKWMIEMGSLRWRGTLHIL